MISRLFHWRSLKTRVTVFTLLIFVIAIWSLAFYASRMLHRDMEKLLGEQQLSTVSFIAAQVNDELSHRLAALELIASEHAAPLMGNRAALQARIEQRPMHRILFNGGVFITGPDGVSLASVPPTVEGVPRIGISFMDRDYIITALKEGKPAIGKPVMGKVLQSPIVAMAVPILDDQGKVIGALAGVIHLGKPNFLDKMTDNSYGQTGGYLLIAPQHQMIVTATDKRRIMTTLPPQGTNRLGDATRAGFEGSMVGVSGVGEETLVSLKTIPLAGWQLVGALSTEEAFAPIRGMQQHILLATILLTLLAGGITWWMLRRELAPMLDAAKILGEMAESSKPLHALPITRQDEIGDLIGGFNRLLDIVAQREQALSDSQQKLATSAQFLERSGELAKVGGWEVNLDTMKLGWTLQTFRIAEIDPPTEPSLEDGINLFAPEARPTIAAAVQAAIDSGTSYDLELPLITAKGRQLWIRTQGFAETRDGRTRRLFGTFQDISERKQAEETAHSLLTRLQLLAKHLPGFLYQYQLMPDGSSVFPYASSGIEAIYGLSHEEAARDTARLFAGLYPDDLARVVATIQHSADTLTPWHDIYRVRHPDGRLLWVEGHSTPIRQPDGSTLWHGYIYDITNRKQAEEALRESQAFAQEVLNSVPEHIAVIDPQGTILTVNEGWRQFALENSAVPGELSAATDVGANYLSVCSSAGDDARAARSGIQAVLNGELPGFALEYPCHSPSEQRWFAMSVSPLRSGGLGAVVVHSNITARILAEQEIVQTTQRLANIIWGTGVGTWEWNVQTGETRFNERWAEQIGYTLDELAPFSIDTWMKRAHPDDLAASAVALQKHFAGEIDHYECEARMRHKEGHWVWVLDRGKVVSRTPDGKPEWMAGTHSEISERKQAEESLQRKTQDLARSNAELEQFAYVASHDLRQPLRMVNSYVQMLEHRLADTLDDETHEMMHFATDGAKRMDKMLVSLLEYSRVGRKGEPLALLASRAGVDEALLFLAPAIKEASATVRIAGDWPEVLVSRDEFTRLWQNLIGNAVKYRAPDRNPEIDITVSAEAEGWRFCVADNGIGIAPEQFDRLFKVFQRLHTREQYEGTGIGLAVARKIVERHGGRIWVESAGKDRGCHFCFTLPKTIPSEVMS